MRRLVPGLFSVALTLALIEGSLRIAQPHFDGLDVLLYTPSTRTSYDDVDSLEELLGAAYRPNRRYGDFVMNSRGFRTKEYVGVPKEGRFRIVVLGDSFSFDSGGTPYHEMWTSHLERELNRREPGRPVEVISLGVTGAGPSYELRVWELEHERVRPDHVVLAFFVGNDFTGVTEQRLSLARARDPGGWSHAIRLVRNLFRLHQERRSHAGWRPQPLGDAVHARGGFAVEAAPRDPEHPTFSEKRFLNIETRRMRICLDDQREEFEARFGHVARVLRRLASELRLTGTSLTVMLIPDEYQVNPSLQRQVDRRLGVRPDAIDCDRLQERMRAFLDAEAIPYLDLLPAFREKSRSERLYWPRDTHWNVAGNALAGRLLADHLASRGLDAR